MAQLTERPFPPGDYPVVVVGSGPGGLQTSYALRALGIRHAVISADDLPAGMFRKWPHFQRLISWTKPFTTVPRNSRLYERHDWNSLLADEAENRAIVTEFMDGTSYFPSRPEMEANLVEFAERTKLAVRYGCRWESTRREGERFVLGTSDGDYRCDVAVFAVGVTNPYRPPIPGLELVPHYAQAKAPEAYRDKSVFIVGKRNSGFEMAEGLLARARQIVLASPSAARISILTHSIAAVRARYIQPFEDYLLRGGVYVLDAQIDAITPGEGGRWVVQVRPSNNAPQMTFNVDEVIAATGFTTVLGDLAEFGVRTFSHLKLPAQTPYFESASTPGIYFAGTMTQGAVGLRKHGMASASASLHGYRYNAIILARRLAEQRFGKTLPRRTLEPDALVPYLLAEATTAPELWLQRAYLARVVSVDAERGIVDEGIVPLQHFVESGGPNAVAMTIESNAEGETYPAAYVRAGGAVTEHLLEPDVLLDHTGPGHRAALLAALEPLGIRTAAQAVPTG